MQSKGIYYTYYNMLSSANIQAESVILKTKSQLEKRCLDYQGQIAALREEIQTHKDMRYKT